MATKALFDDNNSDSDGQLKISVEYAKVYNQWRRKEELAKLKGYSSDELESSSDTDEEFASEIKDKAFFKVLSFLKSGNTRLYEKVPEISSTLEPPKLEDKKDKKSEKPMYLVDYQREMILKGGILKNDNNTKPLKQLSIGYYEQQEKIKESFKELNNEDDDEGSDELLTIKHKTKQEKESEDTEYKNWLKGQQSDISKKDAKDLQHLHNYWSNSDLPENEKFLKDFFLNQRYLSASDNDEDEMNDIDLDNDEAEVEEQETFEKKFNFRFQEPDEEYFKTYPRVIKNSLRRPDNRRKLKRTKISERKVKEKERKKEEIKRLKNLKKEEILEKLKQIQKITGNDSLPFDEHYLEEDFDPDKYDEKMKDMFSDDFYTYPENEQKPEFTPNEEDENWDSWDPTKKNNYWEDPDNYEHPDYDAEINADAKKSQETWLGRKKWRLSKFAEIVNQKRPSFDPSVMSFEKYLEEYYKLDYEDLIDDIPCRFKYRTVQCNDFGLSTEEVLIADDHELNNWCSVKKCVQFKTREQELQDINNFKVKSQNIERKQKIIPSLFEEGLNSRKKRKKPKRNKSNSTAQSELNQEKLENNPQEAEDICNHSQPASEEININRNNAKGKLNIYSNDSNNFEENSSIGVNITEKQEKSSKSMSIHKFYDSNHLNHQTIKKNTDNEIYQKQNDSTFNKKKNKKFKKSKDKSNNSVLYSGSLLSSARLMAYGINPKKFRNKEKYKPQK